MLKLLGFSECEMGPVGSAAGPVIHAAAASQPEELSPTGPSYDVHQLYERFRGQDPGPCRDYLLRRGIDPALVNALIGEGTVVHNQYAGRSYCCFAVRDDAGELKCLANDPIEGTGKFVLGTKSPFSCEWPQVKRAKEVFVTEDYLSIKSLELAAPPGLALLGNQLCFEPGLLEKAETIISALDQDRGYPEKDLRVYDLEGHKDPNELLMAVRSGFRSWKEYERKATEHEEQYCRGEFLALRLKWAEIESAELRGEPVDEEQGSPSKRQVKKKRRRRR